MRDVIGDDMAPTIPVVGRAVPRSVEGLSTDGPMGKLPAITVGGLVGLAGFVVNGAVLLFGIEIPPGMREWADEYGVMAATVLVPIITGAITYFKVFSPRSVGEMQAGIRA